MPLSCSIIILALQLENDLFLSLRLLKTNLRNSMTQERISDLAVIYINSDIADNLNVNDIIDKFASVNNRRMQLTLTKILYYRVFFSIVFLNDKCICFIFSALN